MQDPINTSFPLGELSRFSGQSVSCELIAKSIFKNKREPLKCYKISMNFTKDKGNTNFSLVIGEDGKVSSWVELFGFGSNDKLTISANYQQLEKLVLSEIDKEGCFEPEGDLKIIE